MPSDGGEGRGVGMGSGWAMVGVGRLVLQVESSVVSVSGGFVLFVGSCY